jgi:integrative and conjugative element protein (TIGR02256 family)
LKFINKLTGLELSISEELIRIIAVHGAKKYPKEFGGLLLGRYMNNNKMVLVEDIILPKKYKSSKYHFERGSEGLRESLLQKYNATPRLMYVGEWHTHPDGPAKPSLTDMNAMSELACDKNVLITNPLLMIVEIRKTAYEIGFYFFFNNELLKYDLSDNEHDVPLKRDTVAPITKNK